MRRSGFEPRSSDQKRNSLSIRPRGSWPLSDKITLIFAHVPHIFVYHLDRTAYKRCHFIGWGSPLSIKTICFREPSDWSNEVVIYSCYRGQTRSGSHGMEGVEDGHKYRGLRRWCKGKAVMRRKPFSVIHALWPWPLVLKIYRVHPCLMGSLHVKFHDDRCKGKAVMRQKPFSVIYALWPWPLDLKIYRAHPWLMGHLHVKFHDDRRKGKAVMRRKPKCGRQTDGRTWWFQYTPPNFVAGGITTAMQSVAFTHTLTLAYNLDLQNQ